MPPLRKDAPKVGYLELLEPLERRGLGQLVGAPAPVCAFLYYGAVAYDRWSVPRPFVADPSDDAVFLRFLAALRAAEGSVSDNLPVLELHAVQTALLDRFAVTLERRPDVDPVHLTALADRIEALPRPAAPHKSSRSTTGSGRRCSHCWTA